MIDVDTINIVKIFNLPIENNQTTSIDCCFVLEFNKNIYCLKVNDIAPQSKKVFSDLSEKKSIKTYKSYYCDTLWAMDDQGNKYTLYDFSYSYFPHGFDYYIKIDFKGILRGGHLGNLRQQEFDRIEFETEYKKPIKLDFIYNAIHISALPIYYAKEEYSPEEFEWMDELFQPEFKRKVKIALIGKQTFEKIEIIIWRLSEFVFLCYQDMFFYDRLTVFVGENQYVLKCFNRTDNRELRKRSLRTKDKKSNDFCNKALNGKNFINFMTFREESGIVFDVFRTTAYSNSFREDYPLRLSQTMEGLANYLMIANIDRPKYKAMQTSTADKLSGFEIAISSSLTTVIDVFSPFSSDSEKIEFCREIKEHRHKFSHVKMKGDYIHGKKNEQYAEILYTVIRVSIIKRIFGLI